MRSTADSLEHKVGQGIADQADAFASNALAEGKTEPNDYPQNTDNAKCDKALEHRGDDIFDLYHAPVEERKARCHQQYQSSSCKHPGDITGYYWPTFYLRFCRLGKNTNNRYRYQKNKGNNPVSFHLQAPLDRG